MKIHKDGFVTKLKAAILAFILMGISCSVMAESIPTINVYSGIPRNQVTKILDEFKQQYDKEIKFKVLATSVETMTAQINVASRAGAVKADVLLMDKPQLLSLAKAHKDFLTPIKSENFDQMRQSLKKNEYKLVAPLGLDLYVIAYNTDSINEKDVPSSYADLLDPKYKNKLVLASPKSSAGIHYFTWFVTEYLKSKKPFGWSYFSELAKLNPKYVSGHGTIRDLVISGERPLGIQFTFYMVDPMNDGEAVSWVWPDEGVVAGMLAIGIVNKKNKREISNDLADWLLGVDGQHAVAKASHLVPVNKEVELTFADGKTPEDLNIIPADPVYISKHRADTVRNFQKAKAPAW